MTDQKLLEQRLIDAGVLSDLISRHTDPFAFAKDAMAAISNGSLKLKDRGAANARELVAIFYKHKKSSKKTLKESAKAPSFKKYISEAKANRHMTHAEDAMYINGHSGFLNSLCIMDNIVRTLSGSSNSKVNITTKFDGSPVVFMGINPENGKFFVASKKIFNKEPKLNYTNADIDKNHTGYLQQVLPDVLKYGKKLGIRSGIFQGDMMFLPGEVKTKKIDGESNLIFKPNTIVYAVPEDSDMGKQIKAAKIGIVFHTEYTGASMGSLSSNLKIDLDSKMKKTKDVFWMDAYFRDVSGTATFTAKEVAGLRSDLKEIRKIGMSLKGIMNTVSKRGDAEAAMSQYINYVVRTATDEIHLSADGLIDYVENTMETSNVRRIAVPELVRDNIRDVDNLFKLHRKIAAVKLVLMRKLESVKSMGHFLEKGGDLVVTKPEGFVGIDVAGNALKLVDRLEFSKANFCNNKN